MTIIGKPDPGGVGYKFRAFSFSSNPDCSACRLQDGNSITVNQLKNLIKGYYLLLTRAAVKKLLLIGWL